MENMDEYSKFKSLLEYFVDYLECVLKKDKVSIRTEKLKNDVKEGKELPRGEGSGKGPNPKLQELISEWTCFDGCARVCFRISSRAKNPESECNYLQWDETGYNIVAHWENHNIVGLKQLVWTDGNRVVQSSVALTDLGLFDGKEPNEALKKFFDEFKKMYEDNTYGFRKQSQSSTPSQDMDTNKSEFVEKLIELLKASHNLILHGAPGTGKTFLAKKIAEEMEAETAFVQFHPSYDYTDFVEGLRPKNKEGSDEIGFERKDGVFKEFCQKALKAKNVSSVSDNFEQVWENVVDDLNEKDFMDIPLLTGKRTFRVELNENGDGLATRTYENDDYKKGEWIQGKSKFYSKEQLYNIYKGLPGIPSRGHDNYRKAVIEYWKKNFGLVEYSVKEKSENEFVKPFVFIIDEINRGEMSKIFGELFYAIDPGYRGESGKIKTQYQNLVPEGDAFANGFFVPENVYIIGTMNDIDRSVDTMDFAFRRRFAFKEIKANENIGMLDALGADICEKAKNRMKNLNAAIEKIEGLSSAYHIGGAYFLKLKECDNDFEKLWELHLEGLLREYLRGQENIDDRVEKLKKAFDCETSASPENSSGSAQSSDSESQGA